MKIQLPKSDMPLICLDIASPVGAFQMTLSDVHDEVIIDLPEDVLEDEIEVSAMWVNAGNKAVGEVMVLKEAIIPEPKEKDNEDSPIEADAEVAKSPPNEVADEKADKEVTGGPKILLDPVTSMTVTSLKDVEVSPIEADAEVDKEVACGPKITIDLSKKARKQQARRKA